MEYYSAIKKNEILPFAMMWMELEGMMLNEMSVRERQIPYDFTYMWNLRSKRTKHRDKKERSKPRNTRLTIENKLMVTRMEVGG